MKGYIFRCNVKTKDEVLVDIQQRSTVTLDEEEKAAKREILESIKRD